MAQELYVHNKQVITHVSISRPVTRSKENQACFMLLLTEVKDFNTRPLHLPNSITCWNIVNRQGLKLIEKANNDNWILFS